MALEEDNKFKDGKIYRIVSENNNKVYYGSTTLPLSYRMTNHKSYWKIFRKGKGIFLSVFETFDNFGLENCQIELVEAYPCSSKLELTRRERFYIANNECINRSIPSRTKDESYRTWVDQNRDKIQEYARASYHRRKEQVAAKARAKVQCQTCGKMLCRDCLSRHMKMMHKS